MEYLTEYLRLDDLQAPAGPRQEQLKIQARKRLSSRRPTPTACTPRLKCMAARGP